MKEHSNVDACDEKTREFWTELFESKELQHTGITMDPRPENQHSIHVNLPENDSVTHVACSVPPDAIGNRGDKYNEGEPTIYEIILCKGSNIIHLPELGYGIINQFESSQQVIDEIIHIIREITK